MSFPRVSGKYIFNKRVSKKQIIPKMPNTAAPKDVLNDVKVIPMVKLQTHDDKLPRAIAAERAGVSKSSTPMKKGIGPRPI